MEMKAFLPPHVQGAIDSATFPYFFGRSLQDLYLAHVPDKEGTVFVCTQVHNGFGDYIALLKAGWALQKAHPNLNIELVYTYTKRLPEVDLKGLKVHPFLEHPDHPVLEPILEGIPSEELSAEAILAEALYEKMKKSLAIVHIALALNTFDNPLLKEKSLYFAEVGNFTGVVDSHHFNWYSLGFSPFEEGIFLQIPFNGSDIADQFFGYFSKEGGSRNLFVDLVRALNPKAELFIPDQTLPYEEFLYKMGNSAFLVGCTGDNSLSECLAFGKVPFYEMLTHKKELVLSLGRLAEFLHFPLIVDYFAEILKGDQGSVKTFARLFADPRFLSSWKAFVDYIHKYCELEKALVARVRRILFKTAELETTLANSVRDGKISYQDAREQICTALTKNS